MKKPIGLRPDPWVDLNSVFPLDSTMKSAEVARGTQRQFWGTALALDSRSDGTNIEEQGVNVKRKMMGLWNVGVYVRGVIRA